jgi:pyruvate,water dikinase
VTQAGSPRTRVESRANDFIRGFEELRRGDDEIAGYKGANLGELTAGLFPVPAGFVITAAAYGLAMERPARRELLVVLGEALSRGAREEVERIALAIRSDLARTPVPAELALAITSAYRKLGDNVAVAVRSSMVSDDRAGTSLRSATETFPNVKGETNLLEKVTACWMNLWCPSMVGYRQLWNQHSEPSMGVVVQRMMKASKAGLLLTTDPSQPDRSRILIEATADPLTGVPLSSGSADSYSVRKSDMRLVETKLAGDVGPDRDLPPQKPRPTPEPPIWLEGRGMSVQELRNDARVLTNHQAFALSSIGADVERQYGSPQEVDWVFEDGSFYLLRSRSIVG